METNIKVLAVGLASYLRWLTFKVCLMLDWNIVDRKSKDVVEGIWIQLTVAVLIEVWKVIFVIRRCKLFLRCYSLGAK